MYYSAISVQLAEQSVKLRKNNYQSIFTLLTNSLIKQERYFRIPVNASRQYVA